MHIRPILGLTLLAVAFACADEPLTGPGAPDELDAHRWGRAPANPITVMTRNVFIGADVDQALAVTSADQIPVVVAQIFPQLFETDFRVRARLLANEIAWTRPQLIGLQEISTIRMQSPGDAVVGGTEPAEDVLFDYLALLHEALARRGMRYRTVAMVENFDIEVPMLVSLDPLAFDDVRLTDFDVILARHDVDIANAASINYDAALSVSIEGGPTLEVGRGAAAVTATVRRNTIRFVNTHLEPASIPDLLPIQLAQAGELLEFIGEPEMPVVLVGDLNSWAPTGETYQTLIGEGFVDTWLLKPGRPRVGYTCCHELNLLNPTVEFNRRIDLVLYRGERMLRPVPAVVVGDERRNRSPSGLWPSDHGGVFARLGFRR